MPHLSCGGFLWGVCFACSPHAILQMNNTFIVVYYVNGGAGFENLEIAMIWLCITSELKQIRQMTQKHLLLF